MNTRANRLVLGGGAGALALAVAVGVMLVARTAGALQEIRWDNAGNGDPSDPQRWLYDDGSWSFQLRGITPSGETDARVYSAGEVALTLGADVTTHSLLVSPTTADVKLSVDTDGHVFACADSSSAPDWGDYASGLMANGDVSTGFHAWLELTGVYTNVCFVRAGREGEYNASNLRVTIDGRETRVYGRRGDFAAGDTGGPATNCVLEVTGGAYASAGRALRIASAGNAGAAYNRILVSGADSKLVQRPTGDASYLPGGGHHNQVVVENGGEFENAFGDGVGWIGTTYIGNTSEAHDNEFIVRGGGRFDGSAGGEVRLGFNGAHNNTLLVTGAGSAFDFAGQFSVGSGGGASNVFTVADGAKAVNVGWNPIYLGWNPGSDFNEINVDGAGSELDNMHFNTYIGADGGCSNKVNVTNGGKLASRHFFIGAGAGADYNVVNVSGAGSVMSNGLYDISIGAGGSHNVVNVEDGAVLHADRDIFIGGGEGVADASACRDNKLRIFNATLEQPVNYDIDINANGTLVVGGSDLVVDTPWLTAVSGEANLVFEFDERGIAPFTPRWESFIADSSGNLGLASIVIDATKYVEGGCEGGTFVLYQAKGGHSMRIQGTETTYPDTDAFKAIIHTLPADVEMTVDVDLSRSYIAVTIPRVSQVRDGLTIIFK